MEDKKFPAWLYALSNEELAFVKNFLVSSGSLKDMAVLYGLSYPTLRLRLDRLIDKVETADQQAETEFSDLLKDLTFDSRLDVKDAQKLLAIYERDRK